MITAEKLRPSLIEGYAALFGLQDQSGDVVRAGAFGRSLRDGAPRPMLLQHSPGAIAGRWVRMVENSRGLYVRGLIESDTAITLSASGLDGLSIGFRPIMWNRLAAGGRELIDIELVEISLVSEPMQGAARFRILSK
ncbi:MAG: HK97 family phage prohead protease [Pseudomonadota bacterium]